jgi:hypothetical protein
MHWATAIPEDRRPDADPLLELPEEPQAAIATAHPNAGRMSAMLRLWSGFDLVRMSATPVLAKR